MFVRRLGSERRTLSVLNQRLPVTLMAASGASVTFTLTTALVSFCGGNPTDTVT